MGWKAAGGTVSMSSRENKVNPAWRDDWSCHAGLRKNADGSFGTAFSILLPPGRRRCWRQKRPDAPLALRLSSEKIYHFWRTAPGPSD
jgi:hypothetical protein